MGATVATAIIARKERDVATQFRLAHAVSAQSAQPRATLRLDPSIAWSRMERDAIIRTAPNGDYWLDEPSWEAFRGLRRRRALIILALVIVAAAVFAVVRRTAA